MPTLPTVPDFKITSSGSNSSFSHGSAYGGYGPAILGVTWTEGALATIIVALRAWTALRVLGSPGWDLVWVVFAWVLTLIAQVILTLSVALGAGNHIFSIPSLHDLSLAVRWIWLAQYLLLVAAAIGKLAVVALIMRVQGPGHRKKTWFMLTIWTVFAALTVVQIVFVVLQCQPVQKLWQPRLPGNCAGRLRGEMMGYATGSFGAFVDVALAIYPYFVFWQLDLSWRKKLGLSLLMSGGLLAAAVTALKTYYIHQAPKRKDPTYAVSPLAICAFTEVWMIIFLGSIPPLRVLFMAKRNTRSSIRSSRSASTVDSLPQATQRKDSYRLSGVVSGASQERTTGGQEVTELRSGTGWEGTRTVEEAEGGEGDSTSRFRDGMG